MIQWAREHQLETEQPVSVSASAFLSRMREIGPSAAIVVAFGQIFKSELLGLPQQGCINLHASLLPRFRGAAPIQAAIVAGESVTGVTTMLMDEGLDTGDILLQRRVDIGARESAPGLSERLARIGGELVVETLEGLEHGSLDPTPQHDERATLAPRLQRSDGHILWSEESNAIFNRIRGLLPWPGTWSTLRGESVKILWGSPRQASSSVTQPPGTFIDLEGESLIVACGGGTSLAIDRLQRAGRKAVDATAFVNGERLEPGERFG